MHNTTTTTPPNMGLGQKDTKLKLPRAESFCVLCKFSDLGHLAMWHGTSTRGLGACVAWVHTCHAGVRSTRACIYLQDSKFHPTNESENENESESESENVLEVDVIDHEQAWVEQHNQRGDKDFGRALGDVQARPMQRPRLAVHHNTQQQHQVAQHHSGALEVQCVGGANGLCRNLRKATTTQRKSCQQTQHNNITSPHKQASKQGTCPSYQSGLHYCMISVPRLQHGVEGCGYYSWRGVVWSIHRYCISSFAFFLFGFTTPAYLVPVLR